MTWSDLKLMDKSKVGTKWSRPSYNSPPSGAKPPPPPQFALNPNISPEELEKFKQYWRTTHLDKPKVEVVKPCKDKGRMLRFESN